MLPSDFGFTDGRSPTAVNSPDGLTLKRALDHLHKAQGGLEALREKQRLPADLLEFSRLELLEIQQGILDLMQRLREQR